LEWQLYQLPLLLEVDMIGLSAHWMPIVRSAVFVFITSSIIYMMVGWHVRLSPADVGQNQ